MGLFDFVDWGGTSWVKDANDAHDRYVQHLNQMQEAKASWTPQIVELLETNSELIADQHESIFGGGGAEYWAAIAQSEPNVLVNAGVNPRSLEKIDSHVAFLVSAGGAANAWDNALQQYGAGNVLSEVAAMSAEDAKNFFGKAGKALDPKKSPWPWVAAGIVGLLIWREFK